MTKYNTLQITGQLLSSLFIVTITITTNTIITTITRSTQLFSGPQVVLISKTDIQS